LVVANRNQTSLVAIEDALRSSNADVSYIQWRVDTNGENNSGEYQVEIGFNKMRAPDLPLVMDSLRSVPGVSAISRNG
jgi:hypothetical protein